MHKNLILSRDIVTKYNIPYSTITHYTNMGFFTVVRRKGNKRMYSEDEVRQMLVKITQLVNEGYPLRLIRNMLTEQGKIG